MLRATKTSAAKQDRARRRTNLARAIRLTWDALNTHLADAARVRRSNGTRGNERWNAECVREYAEIIATLSVELHELASVDFPDDYESLQKKL
jgi:hypothetical protein